MLRTLRAALVALLAAAAFAAPAQAGGGKYVFDGGTSAQRTQVRAALQASLFDWNVVPAQVTIHIASQLSYSYAYPGHIYLDGSLLDAGRFSWAVVQDEYAHQVDFFLFDDALRSRLNTALGGAAWCHGTPGLAHSSYGCERFASTLVWSYWPSRDNAYRPTRKNDESAAMAPAKFRAMLADVLRDRTAAG